MHPTSLGFGPWQVSNSLSGSFAGCLLLVSGRLDPLLDALDTSSVDRVESPDNHRNRTGPEHRRGDVAAEGAHTHRSFPSGNRRIVADAGATCPFDIRSRLDVAAVDAFGFATCRSDRAALGPARIRSFRMGTRSPLRRVVRAIAKSSQPFRSLTSPTEGWRTGATFEPLRLPRTGVRTQRTDGFVDIPMVDDLLATSPKQAHVAR